MSFKDAFGEGLENARKASVARAEIQSVFDLLAADVAGATGDAIEVRVAEFYRYVMPKRIDLFSLAAGFKERHTGLLVRVRGSNTEGEALCDVELAEFGYPVLVKYANETAYCSGRSSLETALQNVIRHPRSGEVFARLVRESQSTRAQMTPGSGEQGGSPPPAGGDGGAGSEE